MAPRTPEQLARLRERRRREIVRAALDVFVEKGFDAANVADVAARAGVSQGTIYHYFPSKDALFAAAYEAWEVESLYAEVERALGTSDSPREQLDHLARTVADRMVQAADMLPASVEFWSHLPRQEAIRKAFQRLFATLRSRLARIVQSGIDRGEFASVDADETASLLIATYDGLVLQWLADPERIDWPALSRTLAQIVLRGLEPSRTPQATEGAPR